MTKLPTAKARHTSPGERTSARLRAVKVPKLSNLAGVIAELGSLYRAARRGEVDRKSVV